MAVNMCFERVVGVMSSGEGYTGEERGLTSGEMEGDASGWRVVEEETEELSRWEDVREDSEVVLEEGECGVGASKWLVFGDERCCERILFAIRSSLNGDFLPLSEAFTIGLLKSSTVVRIAVVISSRLV